MKVKKAKENDRDGGKTLFVLDGHLTRWKTLQCVTTGTLKTQKLLHPYIATIKLVSKL